MKQKQSSGLWLLTIRWGRMSLSKSLGSIPTVDKAITRDISFIASGRRHETDNYLFLNQRDAESFKVRIEKKLKTKPKWKASVDIVKATPEDVAHLDLDPASYKARANV
jgi:hypothetical protein